MHVLSSVVNRDSVAIDTIDDENSAEWQRLAGNGVLEGPGAISAAGTPVATTRSATTPSTSFDIATIRTLDHMCRDCNYVLDHMCRERNYVTEQNRCSLKFGDRIYVYLARN